MSEKIIVMLSDSFNFAAADMRELLKKYHATLESMNKFATGPQLFYEVKGLDVAQADAFLAECKTLPQVKAAYKQPADALP